MLYAQNDDAFYLKKHNCVEKEMGQLMNVWYLLYIQYVANASMQLSMLTVSIAFTGCKNGCR